MEKNGRTAEDLWRSGCESWREPVEVRVEDPALIDHSMSHGCLIPTKGLTRVSIIFFGLIFSYKNLREVIDADQQLQDDFSRTARPGWGNVGE